MLNKGAIRSPWVVFGFNSSDGEAVRVGAMGGNESYNKEIRRRTESDATGDERGNGGDASDDTGRVSVAMSDELVKAKMVTAEMEAEVKDLRDELQRMKEEMVTVQNSHNKQLKAEETRYSKEFTTQAYLVHELQKTNNELLWSNRELQDRIKSMMDGNEFEIFQDKLQESNAIIVALREENERLSKIIEDIQDAATTTRETCGLTADREQRISARPSEVNIARVVRSIAAEMNAVTRETEKLGLCPSPFQSSGSECSEDNMKSISECVIKLGRLMADAQSSETASREENSILRDKLISAQAAVDSLQNEHDEIVCKLRTVTETLEQSWQEAVRAQMALQDSEISCQIAVTSKEELDGQLSAARAEVESTRVTMDSYVSQLEAMEANRETTELELTGARAEVECYRESMNSCVSELNMLKGVQVTAENAHAIYQQTLEEFGELKNRFSAFMVEAVEYRLQTDLIKAELHRQIADAEAVSEEKWSTAYKELERQMQNQKEENSLQLTELLPQKDEDNLQFTDLLQTKEEARLQLSELLQEKEEGYTDLMELLQRKEQDNLQLANLIQEKELELSEFRQQKDKDHVHFTGLLQQKEEGYTELAELLQQKEQNNLQLTDSLQGKERDRLWLAEVLQQKEEDYIELSELLMKKDDLLRQLEHLIEDKKQCSNLLREKESERLLLSELLQQKEQDYIQMSDMLMKAQDNESEEVMNLQCCLREMNTRLKECDCQLFLSRQETMEAEQNSIRSYEQWTRAYEDLQSVLVAAEDRENDVMSEMEAKLARHTVDLDTAKETVVDLEERLRIATEGSDRMRLEQEEILRLSTAKQNDYLARIEELTSEQGAYVEQLEALKRECSFLGNNKSVAGLEMDSLKVTEVGVGEHHQQAAEKQQSLCVDDVENELKKQIETLSVELEYAQAAVKFPSFNHLARLACIALTLRERNQDIAELKKALEEATQGIALSSFEAAVGSTDSIPETCGDDQANEFKRENTALRSKISSMELQLDSLRIQVDIQTKNMEDMLTTHFEDRRFLELEIEVLKESSSRAARNDNLEGGGEDHSSSAMPDKAAGELFEIMARASNLQHEAKKLGEELSEAREESEGLRAVIVRVLELVGYDDPNAVNVDVCSAVYGKCLEISELQERVQDHENLMTELCELLDCCDDTLVLRVMELSSMYHGIQSSSKNVANTTTTHFSATTSREDINLQYSDADTAAMVVCPLTNNEGGGGGGGEVKSAPTPLNDHSDVVGEVEHVHRVSSPWEDWGEKNEEDNERGGEGGGSKDHSEAEVVPHNMGAVAIDDGERFDDSNSSSSDILLSRIYDAIAVTSYKDILNYVIHTKEMLFALASTLDIPLHQEGQCSVTYYLHLINEVVPAIYNKMSSIAGALKDCGFEENETIDVHFWRWSIDCIDCLRQQRDHHHTTELERDTSATTALAAGQYPPLLLDVLKQTATELNCAENDAPLKVRDLIKLNAELYEVKEKYLKEEEKKNPLMESSEHKSNDLKTTQNVPYNIDVAKMSRNEEAAESSWHCYNNDQLFQEHQGLHVEMQGQQSAGSQLSSLVRASEEQIAEEDNAFSTQKPNEGEMITVIDDGGGGASAAADDIIVCLMEKLSCTEPPALLPAVEALQKERTEVEDSSERLWQTVLQALYVICVALTDTTSDEVPAAMMFLQHRIEGAISASSWHGGCREDESLSLLNSAAEELRDKAMKLKMISVPHVVSPVPLAQEDAIINSRDQDTMSKASPTLYRALYRWRIFYLYSCLHSVREACQQEIAAARKEAEDWVTSHFNFDNCPDLPELKGLQLVLPDNTLIAAEEQQSSVQLERQVDEKNWDKVYCSIKNAAYEVHRAWNDSSAFVSAQQPHSNVGGSNASVIMELESSLKKAGHELETRSRDLEFARNSVSNLQEENHNLHRDLDAMHERLQMMDSSQQQPPDPGNVFGDEKGDSTCAIRSVEPKVLDDASISQSQPTMVGTVSKDIIQAPQKEVGGAKTAHHFSCHAAIDILLVSIYLTVISYGYDTR